MMELQAQRNAAALTWLLEESDPGIRYLALRDIVGLDSTDPDLLTARHAAHTQGPIAVVLDNMEPEGYWVKTGPGYNPKYRSTVWAIILLAQMGASLEADPRLEQACGYILEHTLTQHGHFTASGAPSGTADCLQGNLCWALMELGVRDPRLEQAFEWMARSVTGEGVAPQGQRQAPLRYYASQCGPTFACGSNNKLPCAWGAAKVMLALGQVASHSRTPLIQHAIDQGIDFLFSVDPATADYPCGFAPKPSGNWWKFGFPVFYITDLLQIVEALAALGHVADPRLTNAIALVHDKQDAAGRWPLEYSYTGKTWFDFGPKKQPNKWVTLRALKALKFLEAEYRAQ